MAIVLPLIPALKTSTSTLVFDLVVSIILPLPSRWEVACLLAG